MRVRLHTTAVALCALLAPLAPAQEASVAASEGDTLALRIEDAWQLALERNIGLALEARSREASRLTALGSWGAFDPVFNLSLSYADGERPQNNTFVGGGIVTVDVENQRADAGLTFPFRTGGRLELSGSLDSTSLTSAALGNEDFNDASVSATYVQPLLRGAWERAATTDQELARLRLARTEAQWRQTREQLLLDVHVAYWDLVAALEEVEVRERALELGREQLRQETERERVGVGTEVDVLQAETNVSTREEQLLLARNTVDQREDALKQLVFGPLGEADGEQTLEDWDRELVPLTSLPTTLEHDDPGSWIARLDSAFQLRPDLEVLRADVSIAETELVARRTARDAQLDLSLGISSSASDASTNEAVESASGFDFPTYSAGLTYSIPLGNRSAKYAERSARVELRRANLAYDQAENQVVADLRDALREVYYQAQAVRAATTSREFAERQLEAEQVRYREGLSTTFQVLEFQQTLTEALSGEQTARANLAKARARLVFAEGRLGESLGAPAELSE